MNLRDKAAWDKWVAANTDGYGGACIKIARRVMEELDNAEKPIDASAMILQADRHFDEGITGFMAGAVAQMVSACHERGEEFRRSWNHETQIGDEGDKANESGGVLNPALLNIG